MLLTNQITGLCKLKISRLSWGMKLIFYMFRHLNKQPVGSNVDTGSANTGPDTFKNTPNVVSKDLLYKVEPDPDKER